MDGVHPLLRLTLDGYCVAPEMGKLPQDRRGNHKAQLLSAEKADFISMVGCAKWIGGNANSTVQAAVSLFLVVTPKVESYCELVSVFNECLDAPNDGIAVLLFELGEMISIVFGDGSRAAYVKLHTLSGYAVCLCVGSCLTVQVVAANLAD